MGEEKGLVVSLICCKLTICDLFPCILNSLLLSTSFYLRHLMREKSFQSFEKSVLKRIKTFALVVEV